jgi:hypothetical protein
VNAIARPVMGPEGWSILSLGSGYPKDICDRIQLVMVSPYQVHVDDSGKGQEPVFVLAGWAAGVDQWLDFSTEWARVLKSDRPIDYFKSKDAVSGWGQFTGWEKSDRKAKISALIGVIERHVEAGFAHAIHQRDFQDVFLKKIHPAMDSPYALSFYAMIAMVTGWQRGRGEDRPTDYVFDEQIHEAGRALEAWKFFKELADPTIAKLLGNRPHTDDEKNLMPLQAADLLAWRTRRYLADIGSTDNTALEWFPLRKEPDLEVWERPDLERIFADFVKFKNLRKRKFYYEFNRKDRKAIDKKKAIKHREDNEK